MSTPSPPPAPAPASPVTPVAPPPQTPALAPPPVTPTPQPVTPTPTPPVTPTPSPLPPTPPPLPPTPPPQQPTPPPQPPTPTPTPEPPPPPPPVSPAPPPPQPRPTPTPTPVTPSPPPPRPVTPSPPPPRPVTPSPPPPANVPVPSPPPPAVNPPPPVVPTSPPPRNDVPTSPPPPDVPTSPPPPNDVPASPAPPPSHLSLSPPPPPQSAEAPSTSASSPKSNSGTVVGVGVAVAAVVVLGLAAGLIYFFVARRRRHRRRPPPAPGFPADFYDPRRPVTPPQQSHALSTTPSSTPPLMHSWESSAGPSESPLPPFKVSGGTFLYDELAAAADGFSDANLLGQGGFGHVYKGTVRGQEVAIKKLRAGSGQGDREFRAEVEIISRVHHKNLVSLVGYCIHGEQRLLVYEYVPNKTLEFHLHGSGRPTLDWPRRWKIAVGSAKGLAYLHEDCHPKIIHRDIKAANILLDYNYEPKVADFGLAKYQAAEATSVSTRVMGTFGYLAPEYAATGKVNDRSDVFSCGVMLLELITGRKPIMTYSAYEPETLVSWARPLLTKAVEEENYEELIDPRLETNYDAYDMARLIECAAAAVRQTARSRPRMTQIVRYLEGELSVEDLNAGVAPGQSAMQRTSGGGTTDQIRRLRRMAFGSGTGTGTITEYTSSEFSEPTSEYGLNPSSEYTSSAAETGEIVTEAQTTGTGRRAAEGGGGEASTERMSRRTTASRQAGRAGRG